MKTILIGAQFGDEGKGKVADFLARGHEVVVRYQGGANAGHTVYRNGQQYVFRGFRSLMVEDRSEIQYLLCSSYSPNGL